jgi:hydroxypyruvate isomerase
MTAWIVLAALIVALSLSALMVSVYAFWRAQRTSQIAAAEVDSVREECANAMEAMRKEMEAVAAGMQDLPRHMSLEPLPVAAKPGMNLSRRSQALRLRRKGESPQKIAETLDMPRQEVDLLLKVHEIVLNSV